MSDLVDELTYGNENSGRCTRDPMSWLKVSLPVLEDGPEVNENKEQLLATSPSNQAAGERSSDILRESESQRLAGLHQFECSDRRLITIPCRIVGSCVEGFSIAEPYV